MGYFIAWIIFSVVAGAVGSGRTCGFAGAFFASLFLSPLVGLIIAFASSESKNTKVERISEEERIRVEVRKKIEMKQ